MTHQVTKDQVTLVMTVDEFIEVSKAVTIVGKAHLELGTEPPLLPQVARDLTAAAVDVVMLELEDQSTQV